MLFPEFKPFENLIVLKMKLSFEVCANEAIPLANRATFSVAEPS